jgi:hypothetical protein
VFFFYKTQRLLAAPVGGEPTNPTPGPSLVVQMRASRSVHLAAALEPLG